MGQTALIFFLLLATGVAVFAVQNAGPVVVRFGFWSLEMSLVVVILVAMALGAVMAALLSLPGWVRDRRTLRHQARALDALRASQATTASPLPPPAAAADAPSPEHSQPEPPTGTRRSL
ncbi:MAG: LapA family protein [Zetaproteobacteria bacterium]|nr:MAG: LapA family protein [Zetaproteobacteria bacterium]